jgi:cation diffusion facilitator CzcD-associated flavoprotein CzcO
VGSGHSGLELAARLKLLGVRALVVERNHSIGDNWRNRYGALCLHWPVCEPLRLTPAIIISDTFAKGFDHMAYIP